jgi:hypothetical protein
MLRVGYPPHQMFDWPGYLCPHVLTTRGTLFLTKIFEERFPSLVEEMGVAVLDDIAIPTQPGKSPNGGIGANYSQCITIADSYVTGNRKPSSAQIETLRQFFGIGEGEGEIAPRLGVTPKWYVDSDRVEWEVFHSREYQRSKWYRRVYRKYGYLKP